MKNLPFTVWLLMWPLVVSVCRPFGWTGSKQGIYVVVCSCAWMLVALLLYEKKGLR